LNLGIGSPGSAESIRDDVVTVVWRGCRNDFANCEATDRRNADA